jgi:choline dehydrogenase-like flavoprotein
VTPGQEPPQSADVVIVGAGAAGLAFAWRLVQPGLRVVCLERGGPIDQRASPSLTDDWELALQTRFNANPNLRAGPADHPVDDSASAIRPAFFNAVGGSTIRWGAQFPRFRPSDFRVRSLDGVGADWPVTYDDLVPWYDLNDRMMGVAGLAGDPANPARAPRPTGPLPLCPATERLAAGFDRLGWHWWPSDAAILSAARDDREGCNNCGPCGLGCPRHARASADIAYLPGARERGLELVTGATVTGIEMAGDRVFALRWHDAAGRSQRLVCGEAVLAGNGLGTARLMLGTPELAHPLLGRGLMLHPTAIVTGRFAEPMQSWRGAFAASILCQEFYETDPARGFLRGFQMQALREQGPLATALGGYGTRLPWGAGHAAAFDAHFGHTVSLTVTCEDLPEEENRIALDPDRVAGDGMAVPRMIYRLGENSRRMRDFGVERATEALREAGAEAVTVTPLARNAGFHLMGTARMGTDPGTSVLAPDGRPHGVANLTVADGALFPSAAAVNPTPTLQAMALRLADGMRARLGLAA